MLAGLDLSNPITLSLKAGVFQTRGTELILAAITDCPTPQGRDKDRACLHCGQWFEVGRGTTGASMPNSVQTNTAFFSTPSNVARESENARTM